MTIYENACLIRPRVNRLLEQASEKPFIVVCAGTGYGKTQAVQSFCQTSGGKVVWLQITRQDNDETRFWEKLIHTVFQNEPDLEKELLFNGMPKTDTAIEKYIEILEKTFYSHVISPKLYTVYDDLHRVENPNVLRFLREMIRYITPKRTVIMISQSYPFPELTGPTARESASLISEEDLLFTEEEISEYLRLLGVSVSTGKVRRVMEGTKGWAQALGVVGHTIQNAKDPGNDIIGAMQVNIYKLMKTDVQDVISDRLKNLLFRLSLLDHLPADLVLTLAGGDESLIGELGKCCGYVRYDIYMNMYVIHDFFRDFIRQYQDTLTEGEKREVFREAGHWCGRNGYILYAVNNYEKAMDYEALIRLVYSSVNRQIPPDMAAYLLTILEGAPPEAVKNIDLFPVLHLRLLISLDRQEDVIKQGKIYENRYLAMPESPETTRIIAELNYCMGVACQMRSTVIDRYDFHRYFLRQDLFFSKNPYQFQKVWQPSLSIGFWVTTVGTGRAGAIEEYIREQEKSYLALIHARGGYGAGKVAAARGEMCFYQGQWKSAEQYFKDAVREASGPRQYDLWMCALFYLLRLCFVKGDYKEAEEVLRNMEKLLEEEFFLSRYTYYDIVIGWYSLHLRQPQKVPDWLKGSFSVYTHPKFIENAGNQLKAYYHFQTGNYAPLFVFMAEKRERATILFERLEMQAMEACALYISKNKGAAFKSFGRRMKRRCPTG